MGGYIGLFSSAFFAATLLPFSSEAVLGGLLASQDYNLWGLWAVATLGNTLGAMVNWALGRWCLHWQDRKWFPFKEQDLKKADAWFSKWGAWSLLLSWVPIIGDPITFAAGFLRVHFAVFSLLVVIAKGGRYLVVLAVVNGFM